MFSGKKFVIRVGALGTVLMLAVGAYGFTAANVVPTTKAGDGQGTVSGYTVSAVHYNLNSTTPTNVDSITFNLDSTPAAGSTLKVKVGGNWYTCTNAGATLTCNTTAGTQLTVVNATSLEALTAD